MIWCSDLTSAWKKCGNCPRHGQTDANPELKLDNELVKSAKKLFEAISSSLVKLALHYHVANTIIYNKDNTSLTELDQLHRQVSCYQFNITIQLEFEIFVKHIKEGLAKIAESHV